MAIPNDPAATPQMPAASTGPLDGPMTAPQPNEGEQLQAESQMLMILDALMATAQKFGATSPKGRKILQAAAMLSKEFGGPSEANAAKGSEQQRLMELAQLLSSQQKAPGAGGLPGAPQGMPPVGVPS